MCSNEITVPKVSIYSEKESEAELNKLEYFRKMLFYGHLIVAIEVTITHILENKIVFSQEQ